MASRRFIEVNPRPVLTLIAAVSADGFISTGTGVPWDLPKDRQHFRQTTAGQWLLIGRRTYLEMLGWFQDHRPLVLSRDKAFTPPVGETVAGVEEALTRAAQGNARELFVCGGGGAYTAAMPWADRLILTHVAATLGGGVRFPPISKTEWRQVSRQDFPADADHPCPFAIAVYERRREAQNRGGN